MRERTAKIVKPRTLRDREFESSRALILEALKRNGMSMTVAAVSLSVSRTTLWRRCKRLGITFPRQTKTFVGDLRKMLERNGKNG